jgi:hypothetical protein
MAEGVSKSPWRTDVERIVREVLAEMGTSNGPSEHAGEEASRGELVLSSKVISVAELADRLDGISRLIVPRGAIFTPAARDELRKHQVAVASAVPAKGATTAARLVVGVADTNYPAAPLVDMLANDGIKIERLAPSDLAAIVDNLCQRVVQNEQRGLLITERAAAAVCLANRQRGVRAALSANARAVTEAIDEIATNLLVVNPSGKSNFELRQMAREFVRAGQTVCPPALRERLG